MNLSAVLGTAGAILAVLGVGVPVAEHPASTAGGACPGTSGVTVVVDASAFGRGVQIGCAAGDPDSGLDALTAAGFSWTFVPRQIGLVCTIGGQPDPCRISDTAYWSYWHARPGGSWVYSTDGAGTHDPAPGAVEGWSFGSGSAPAVPPPAAAAPVTAPSTTPSTAANPAPIRSSSAGTSTAGPNRTTAPPTTPRTPPRVSTSAPRATPGPTGPTSSSTGPGPTPPADTASTIGQAAGTRNTPETAGGPVGTTGAKISRSASFPGPATSTTGTGSGPSATPTVAGSSAGPGRSVGSQQNVPVSTSGSGGPAGGVGSAPPASSAADPSPAGASAIAASPTGSAGSTVPTMPTTSGVALAASRSTTGQRVWGFTLAGLAVIGFGVATVIRVRRRRP